MRPALDVLGVAATVGGAVLGAWAALGRLDLAGFSAYFEMCGDEFVLR